MPELPIDLNTLVTESLKPVSAFVDAIIGPSVRRLKVWSERRDLEVRTISEPTAQVFEDYLRRIMKKVSGITTVLAPAQSFPINEIYEPIFLRYMHYKKGRIYKIPKISSSQENINLHKILESNTLIIDSAGMGKSTFVKHLALNVLQSTRRMPIFFELRRLGDSDTLISKIMEDIDNNSGILDDRLFLNIIKQGGFTIILDGFDEVHDEQKQTIADQISLLSRYSDHNSLILTSRPETIIPEFDQVSVFECVPFTREQSVSAIQRMDILLNLDSGIRLIEQFDSIPPYFLEVPLLF